MDGTVAEDAGWEHISPEPAAVARRAGISAADLDALRDDPADQPSGVPDLTDEEWERILAPMPAGPATPAAPTVARSPILCGVESLEEPDTDDRRRVLARLEALRLEALRLRGTDDGGTDDGGTDDSGDDSGDDPGDDPGDETNRETDGDTGGKLNGETGDETGPGPGSLADREPARRHRSEVEPPDAVGVADDAPTGQGNRAAVRPGTRTAHSGAVASHEPGRPPRGRPPRDCMIGRSPRSVMLRGAVRVLLGRPLHDPCREIPAAPSPTSPHLTWAPCVEHPDPELAGAPARAPPAARKPRLVSAPRYESTRVPARPEM